ncbi:MAG: CAAX prenyl protease-related protein [Isosphaeraceae bacterium]
MSTVAEQPQPSSRTEATPGELIPYIVPMLAFLVLTSLEGSFPQGWYPVVYAAKVLAVAVVAWLCRRTWLDLKPVPRVAAAALAVATGVVVYLLWVGLEGFYPSLGFLGKRTGFDPSTLPPGWKWPFVAIRLFGLVLLVPLIEELFWRSFLMRWLINPDFVKVPVGRVTPVAAAITSVAFAIAHPEWLPALLTGGLWAWLLWKTGSLSACVLSHAVANLALGLHVLATGDWKYW